MTKLNHTQTELVLHGAISIHNLVSSILRDAGTGDRMTIEMEDKLNRIKIYAIEMKRLIINKDTRIQK